ncbi:TetR family transcriptional regulator [Kitasatospora sp. NPDC092948]|uniref:TetR family transcriptional regulator n=1 Tax=Kitasatospora sp. NPDC092948 TaxID=3364088 RepID=UPI00382AB3AE
MTGQVRTVDGRVAGRRGQETRQKLLDCLREMLSTSPYRDVKVIDVARMAGTSPATFYQYFPDVEGAVLEIAEEMAEDSGGLKELVDGKSWAGKTGFATSEELVDGFLAFWRKNDAILRVVTLGAAEGDKRFFKIRMKVLNSVASPLAEAVRNTQGKTDKTVDGSAIAGALVTLLAASAEHSKAFTSWGVKVKDLKPSLALQVYLGVTGKKPPK